MDNPLVQLTDRVWYLPADPDPYQTQPLVGVVVGEDETILLDAGNTPKVAWQIHDALQLMQAPPVSTIIYTHHHWDHVFGAYVFAAEVIAHQSCQRLLVKETQKPWSVAYLKSQYASDNAYKRIADVLLDGISDWDRFQVVVPSTVFESSLQLHGKGYALELEYVGGKHAADSIIIKVAGDRVMFVGDSFYPPPARLNQADKMPDVAMVTRFAAEHYDYYLHGHGQPMSHEVLLKWLEMEQ